MKLKINFYRRWDLDVPLERVFRDLNVAIEWAKGHGAGVSEVRMGDLLWYGGGGVVGRKCAVSGGYDIWRLCFESARSGVVCFEVYNPSSGVLSWVKRLYYVLTHGLKGSELESLRVGYRKDLRVLLGRSASSDSWVSGDGLLDEILRLTVPLVCEYLGFIGLHKFFGSDSSSRVLYGGCGSKVWGCRSFCDRVEGLFRDEGVPLAGSLQPEETVEMLTWLRLYYESVYRKCKKVLEVDESELHSVMGLFEDKFMSSWLSLLRDGRFLWSSSLLGETIHFMEV